MVTGAPFIEVFLGEGEIVVEAVGMWESRSDFQGRWETEETDFGFPPFSSARHFHSRSRSALFHADLFTGNKSAKSTRLACCIRFAASVSLSAPAFFFSASTVCPGFK